MTVKKIIDKKTIEWVSTAGHAIKIEAALVIMESIVDNRLTYPTIVFFVKYKDQEFMKFDTDYKKRETWAKCYDAAPDHVTALMCCSKDCMIGLIKENMNLVDSAIKELNKNQVMVDFEQEKQARKAKYDAQRKLERQYDAVMNEGGEGYNPYRSEEKPAIREPYQKGDLVDN